MKVETRYICEICGERYATEDVARRCEGQGEPKKLPVGLMTVRDFYGPNFAFALKGEEYPQLTGGKRRHYLIAHMWACRDRTGGMLYNDTLGDDSCGSGDSYHPQEFDSKWLFYPPFQRLAAWLRSQGITPTVWRNGEVVALDDITKAEANQ